MTSLLSFLARFAVIGLLIPLIFMALSRFYPVLNSADLMYYATRLALILWPASIMNIPASSEDPSGANELFVISTVANMVFYILIGLLVWLGLKKHCGFFVLLGFLLFVLWWRLLTL